MNKDYIKSMDRHNMQPLSPRNIGHGEPEIDEIEDSEMDDREDQPKTLAEGRDRISTKSLTPEQAAYVMKRSPNNKWAKLLFQESSNKILARMETGFSVLANAIMEEARTRRIGCIKGAHEGVEFLRYTIREVVMAIPSCFLCELVGGSIAGMEVKSLECRKLLREYEAFAETEYEKKFPPCIYIRTLSNEKGESPSPRQLFKILGDMKDYADGKANIRAVDAKQGGYNSKAGVLSRYCKDRSARLRLRIWCGRLERTVRDRVQVEDYDSPLPSPLVYIGFATDNKRRKDQHKKHLGYNPMYLMETLFSMEFSRKLGPNLSLQEVSKLRSSDLFRMVHHVVYIIPTAAQVAISEIVITMLADSMLVYNGLGFNIGNPGENNAADYDDDQWSVYARFSMEHSPWIENCEVFRCQSEFRLNKLRAALTVRSRQKEILDELERRTNKLKTNLSSKAWEEASNLEKIDVSEKLKAICKKQGFKSSPDSLRKAQEIANRGPYEFSEKLEAICKKHGLGSTPDSLREIQEMANLGPYEFAEKLEAIRKEDGLKSTPDSLREAQEIINLGPTEFSEKLVAIRKEHGLD
jgi:hypothetical protein